MTKELDAIPADFNYIKDNIVGLKNFSIYLNGMNLTDVTINSLKNNLNQMET